MPATILMHPRLDADEVTREQLTERLADLLAHEEVLRWQAVPEAEATYWRLFGDLEAGQTTICARGAAQRAARRTEACVRQARTRRRQAALTEAERREFIALHRRLVRRLHPQLDARATGPRYLWSMVRRACRDGDLAQLRDCDAGLEQESQLAGLPESFLCDALRDVQSRIRRLYCDFPLNLRHCMADAEWVASRRAALRRRLPAQAHG